MNGLFHGMPEAEYHAHRALSSTEARLILDAPAKYRWAKDNPPAVKPSKKFDIGSAVHSKVLGTGYPVAVIPDEILASNGAASTAAAKEFIEQARLDGKLPLKRAELEPIAAQAEAVLRHPFARVLFTQPGLAEASAFATDPATGISVRARFDYLPDLTLPHPVAVDLKTSATPATPDAFGRSVATYGYDVQEEHYLFALDHAGVDGNRPDFAFVEVEKEPPYLVAVFQLPELFRDRGRRRARRARELFAECTRTGVWPGRSDDVQVVDVPNWVIYEEEIEPEMEVA